MKEERNMSGSYIAKQIDDEYRAKQYYAAKQRNRSKCKEQDCYKCVYCTVCDYKEMEVLK